MGDLDNPEAIFREHAINMLRKNDVVKLCIIPRTGVNCELAIADAIRAQVREKVATYGFYPRITEHCEMLPLTTTGTVKRRDIRWQHIDVRDA